MRQRCFSKIVTWTVIALLYVPIATLAISSFNASRFSGQWTGLSLQWYKQLFHDPAVWNALLNSMIIASYSSVAATVLGTLAALAIYSYRSSAQKIHATLIVAPLVMPDILLGISLLLLFVILHINLSLLTVFIAHATFSMSYIAMIVKTRLDSLDRSLLEAARDLGASSFQMFYRVMLPWLMPAIISGWLLAFTLSLDDFVITFFVVGPGATTLPIYIYSMMKFGSPPVINALSTLLILLSAGITSVYYRYAKAPSL